MAASAALEVPACAILANHAHVVVERNDNTYERIVNHLKGRSSQWVRKARHMPPPASRRQRVPIWTQGYWVRYIDHLEQMECAVRYVRNNPIQEGLPAQNWDFVRNDYECI